MADQNALHYALRAVAKSDYPVYLGPLHDTVNGSSPEDLQSWGTERPSDLSHVATAVIEQVSLRLPLALETFTQLCRARIFRDAFLEVEPTLLHLLLEHSSTSSLVPIAQQASVALLRYPLPSHIELPATLGRSLVDLFDKLNAEPKSNDAFSIFYVLEGAGPSLLRLLAPSKLLRFMEHVRNLSRTIRSGEKDPLVLSLRAIQAVIHHCSHLAGSEENSTAQVESTESTICNDVHDVFYGKYAENLARYALLFSISVSSTKSDLQSQVSCEYAQLAARILQEVDPTILKGLCNKQPELERKLHERADGANLPPQLRLQITSEVGILEKVMSRVFAISFYERTCSETVKEESEQDLGKRLRSCKTEQIDAACPQKTGAITSLVHLLLKVAIGSRISESPISSDLSLAFLEVDHALAAHSIKTARRQAATMKKSDIPPPEVPQPPVDSHNWRLAVRTELQQSAEQNHGAVMSLFSRACNDMDRRCQEAEKPWKEEEARHNVTRSNLDAAHARISELEGGLANEAETVSRLQRDASQNQENVARSETERSVLVDERADLQRRLEEAIDSMKEQTERARAVEHQMATEHQTALAKLAEQIDDRQMRLMTKEQQVEDLEQKREQMKLKLTEKEVQVVELHDQRGRLEGEAATLEGRIAMLEDRIEAMNMSAEQQKVQAAKELGQQRLELETNLDTTRTNAQATEQHLRSELKERDTELEELRSLYEAERKSRDESISELESRVTGLTRDVRSKDAANVKLQRKWSSVQQNMQQLLAIDEDQQTQEMNADSAEELDGWRTEGQAAEEPSYTQLEDAFASSFGSSSSRSGPTPKRMKPRFSLNVPASKSTRGRPQVANSPAKVAPHRREPLQETARNQQSRKSMPAIRQKAGVMSPAKLKGKSQTRVSLAVPQPLAMRRREEQENVYVSRDEVPASTMRTEDLDATTEEFE
ncbi:MAG: hypothetical protein Q9159_003913 [Coniocarpon cinnabarinum]